MENKKIANYNIIKKLGGGVFGTVYKVSNDED